MDSLANLIDGEWVGGTDMVRNVNPSNLDDVVGLHPRAGAPETEAAIRAGDAVRAEFKASRRARR